MRLHKGLGFIESITKTFSFLSYFADKCQISLAKATFLFSENSFLFITVKLCDKTTKTLQSYEASHSYF